MNKLFLSLLLLLSVTFAATAQQEVGIIAHRGYWKTDGSAQNSIRSLKLADKIGAYGSEFDVHLTADNVAVVFHDSECNGIPIQTNNYSRIKNLRLPNGEKIPTLAKYLKNGKKLKTARLIFELKAHATPERNREAARLSVEAVRKAKVEDRTEYITFNLDAGKELIRLAPEADIYYLNGDLSPKELKELGFRGLDYNHSVMKKHPEWFKEAHDLGLLINIWTVDDLDLMRDFISRGADFITTDIPVDALKTVSSKEPM